MAAQAKSTERGPAPPPGADARPPDYSPAIAAAICTRIVLGESLRRICASAGLPPVATVLDWIERHADFAEQFRRARELQADLLVDDLLDMADDEAIDASDKRIRFELAKWLAARLNPRKYGERGALEPAGSLEALTDDQLGQRIRALLARIDGAE